MESRNSPLGPLDPAGAAVLTEYADGDAFLVELRHIGGALARADGRAVVGRRDGEFVLYTGSALPPRPIVNRPRPPRPACTTRWRRGGSAPSPRPSSPDRT